MQRKKRKDYLTDDCGNDVDCDGVLCCRQICQESICQEKLCGWNEDR